MLAIRMSIFSSAGFVSRGRLRFHYCTWLASRQEDVFGVRSMRKSICLNRRRCCHQLATFRVMSLMGRLALEGTTGAP